MRLIDEMKEMVERQRLVTLPLLHRTASRICLPKDRSRYGTMRLSCLLILPPPAHAQSAQQSVH